MNNMLNPDTFAERASTDFTRSLNRVYNFTYGWMAAGLALSGIVAWYVAQCVTNGTLPLSRGLFLGCTIAELAIVFLFASTIHKLPVFFATLLFAGYAALNGVTLSVIFLIYKLATIQSVFFVTAGMFAGMALFGSLTRINLSGVARICGLGLWGIIIASLVNIFLGSSGLQSLITYVGVAVFVGLTAWDAQKVRLIAEQQASMDTLTVRRLGLLCALELYLDFINLFIFLLRIFGGKGRD